MLHHTSKLADWARRVHTLRMEAVILVGVQGSGKTSFYQQRFLATHVRLSLDQLRTRRRERILLAACLQAGQPFVVDNTNPGPEQRAVYIDAARAAGFRVIGYFLECSLGEALQRNRARQGRARVPDGGVVRTFRRLKPPAREEGFDELYRVRGEESGEGSRGAPKGGRFQVEPLRDI